MDQVWEQLTACSVDEFLQTTRLILALFHNIIQEPFSEKHKRLRASSKFLLRPGVVELLISIGFQQQGEYYILPDGDDKFKQLRSCMRELVTRRRQTGSPFGWDIPSSALHFTKVLGMSKYGDIFQGHLDGQEVAIKTLKPDCTVIAKNSFKRELDILSKLNHPHVVRLLGATLLAEPTSLILELLPHSMLSLLHHGELCDVEVFRYARQVAMGMEYLHSQNILHCDLAARNLLVSAEGEVKISDFSLSRFEHATSLDPSQSGGHETTLNIRWTAPEVLRQGLVSKKSDVWSYGILLYEFVTAGSVPYANFSNSQVKAKISEGYRLAQPHGCLEEFYALMMKCWAVNPTERPLFREVISLLLDPMETMLASISDERPPRPTTSLFEDNPIEKKLSKKCKVKEPSYQSVLGKGGGLLRVYTALVAPFHPRVIIVCSKKTTMVDIVQIALAKCGKHELDHRSYAIALLDESHQPVKYLGPDDKVMNVKATVSPSAQFVLCIRTPEKSLLEVIASIKQNPAYRNALDTRTRGYLVKSDPVSGGGSLKPKNCSGWQRYWCLLDGSSLLCYSDEEDEGVKQFETSLDFRGANVAIVSDKKSNIFKVETQPKEIFLFTSIDKVDTLRWIEAIESSIKLEPSPALLQASGGSVVHTGFLSCHKFPFESNINPLQSMSQTKLGDSKDSLQSVPVNYGKLWSVIKNTGLVQCMIDGKPETLVTVANCNKIRIQNPHSMNDSTDYYCLRLETSVYIYILKAETPTDHYEWVLALEGILRELNLSHILIGDKCRQSGYIALKRLMSLQETGVRGSQLVSPMSELEVLRDVYSDVMHLNSRASPDGCEEKDYLEGPPVPPRGSSAPPPPLPPRDPPPLPPKRGNSLQRTRTGSMASTLSNASSMGSVEFDEYVVMQPPTSLKFTSPTHSLTHYTNTSSQNCSIPSPITEGEDYMPMKPAVGPIPLTSSEHKDPFSSPSLPVSIPGSGGRRGSSSAKRCILLRTTSDSDSSSQPSLDATPPLPPRGSSPRHNSSGSTSSLSRNVSHSSLNSSMNGRNLRERGIGGYSTTLFDKGESSGRKSPLIPRSGSVVIPTSTLYPRPKDIPGEVSVSDGIMVHEAKEVMNETLHSHAYSQAGSISSVLSSENGLDISGLSSSGSSTEDITSQPLPQGWKRGYCHKTKRHFFFNIDLGISKWNYDEVMLLAERGQSMEPGEGWNAVCMDDGRTYYYHEASRQTTWNLQETYA